MNCLTEDIAMQKLLTLEKQMEDIKMSEGPDKDPFTMDNDEDEVVFSNPIESCSNAKKSHPFLRTRQSWDDKRSLI